MAKSKRIKLFAKNVVYGKHEENAKDKKFNDWIERIEEKFTKDVQRLGLTEYEIVREDRKELNDGKDVSENIVLYANIDDPRVVMERVMREGFTYDYFLDQVKKNWKHHYKRCKLIVSMGF